jgi:hypothetical protein
MKNLSFLLFLLTITTSLCNAAPSREFYELRTYKFSSVEQQSRVETYLQKALLPALHRANIKKIGVFKPLDTDSLFTKRIVVLIPFKSLEEFDGLYDKLNKDKQYLTDGKDYIDALYDNAPYTRFETIVLKAFSGQPQMTLSELKGPLNERVYELRSYESYTEKIYRNKVEMFNAGDEVGLFKRLGFNAVFYGEVLSGSTMPNLMYMTTFDNMTSRDEHWKAFVADDQWKKLIAMPYYQKNVSKNTIYFLRPTGYSDI